MTTKGTATAIITAILILGLAAAANAAKGGNGKGKGGSDDDDSSSITPATITLRDDFSSTPPDRVGSDNGGPYVHGEEGVEAFLGSQANKGNVWLKLANSPRGLSLDLLDCVSACENRPFEQMIVDLSSIKVEADEVQKNGLFGMAVGLQIYVPMRIFYDLDDGVSQGFVHFNPNQTGSSPCKNKGNFVSVTRTGDNSWEVSADDATMACVAVLTGRGGHDELGGIYRMPFNFTVLTNP